LLRDSLREYEVLLRAVNVLHGSNGLKSLDIKIGNRCFENVAQFRYFGMIITNENLIQEEIKGRLNSGNACYHSVQNLLSSRLLSKNRKCTKL
jgi:hypothetical protein